MKSSLLERKFLVCPFTVLMAAVPIIFAACGSGVGTLASKSQQSTEPTVVSLESVSPMSGPAVGGTSITITGSNFHPGAGVTIGGFAATSVTVTNSNTIHSVTPAHSSGSVSVTVTNSDGQSASLSSGFTFHSIDLMWTAPTSPSVTIIGYNVYRASSSGGSFAKLNGPTPNANTSFTDPTVQGSSTYYYEVTSVATSGVESSPAGPVQATTGP